MNIRVFLRSGATKNLKSCSTKPHVRTVLLYHNLWRYNSRVGHMTKKVLIPKVFRPFSEFILSWAEGLRVTSPYFARRSKFDR